MPPDTEPPTSGAVPPLGETSPTIPTTPPPPPTDPAEPNDDSSDPDDITELQAFLVDLEMIVDDLVKHPRPAIPGRHHRALQESWSRTASLRAELRKALGDLNSAPKLKIAGLSPEDLKFKLAVFAHARDELLDLGLAGDGDPKDLRWWQRWIPHCKTALQAGGVIVGSLAKAFNWAEPLNECLGAIDVALDLGSQVIGKWRKWWQRKR